MKQFNNTQKVFFFIILISSGMFLFSCAESEADKMTKELETFIKNYETKVIPLMKDYNEALFKASVSGDVNDYKETANLEVALTKIYANKDNFEILKKIKESNLIEDSLLKRQLDILYNEYIPYQLEEEKLVEIIMLENEIQKTYSTFRPRINDKPVTENMIMNVMSSSKDLEEIEKYWRASKKVGREIDDKLIELVKKRNSAAKELGFHNYYEMMMITSGQDPEEIDNIFDELDILTRGPYTQLKQEIDEYLHQYYGIAKADLMPWHYQDPFFQEAPQIFNVNFDKYFENQDIVGHVNKFFTGIGMDMNDVLEKSDLFPKEGKVQLAQAFNIDRNGDIRMIANLENDAISTDRILYETGFASTMKYVDSELPFILRQPAHFMVSDAIGILFSRLAKDPLWLKQTVNVPEEEIEKIKEISAKQLRLSKFVFSRWAQVVYRFERELYANPEQDLNKLWWDLVQNYQMVNKPLDRNEPDWASKTHIVSMPCTYHNYILGELYASQICFFMKSEIFKSDNKIDFTDNKAIGEFLIGNILKYGATYNWNDLIKKSTKESLSPDYFSTQFIHVK